MMEFKVAFVTIAVGYGTILMIEMLHPAVIDSLLSTHQPRGNDPKPTGVYKRGTIMYNISHNISDWQYLSTHIPNITSYNNTTPCGFSSENTGKQFDITLTSSYEQDCMKINVPGECKVNLVGDVIPVTEEISISEVNAIILKDKLKVVENLLKQINMLNNSLNPERNYTKKLLSSISLEMEDYIYIPGGHWKPKNCTPKWKVAFLLPFRDRQQNLNVFLRHMIPFLKTQQLQFGFYVTVQNNNATFNKGMLTNVCFKEALQFMKWDCVVTHDLDLLPRHDHNYYGCHQLVKHFISGLRKWNYGLIYYNLFGGVVGFRTELFRQINGFPNIYWGWGGEDDEVLKRLRLSGLHYARPENNIGKYDDLQHHPYKEVELKRHYYLRNVKYRYKKDGLSNLRYNKPTIQINPLYIEINVDITKVWP